MNEEAMRRAHEDFERDGLVLIPGLFTGDEIDKHNEIVRAFRVELSATQGSTTSVERIGQLHQLDNRLMLLACNPFIRDFLSVQLKDAPRLFGSLNFEKGTEQKIHVDAIFFWPDPSYAMAGVWVALEDVHDGNGPLQYLPGSHRWGLIRSEQLVAGRPDLQQKRNAARLGHGSAQERQATVSLLGQAWTDAFSELACVHGVRPRQVLMKKGDAVVWHSLLAHGGSPVTKVGSTRRSVVFHYLGRCAKLYSFEQYMLLNEDEFEKSTPENLSDNEFQGLEYCEFPYYVSYEGGKEVVHSL